MNIDNFIETYFEVHIKDSIIYVGDQETSQQKGSTKPNTTNLSKDPNTSHTSKETYENIPERNRYADVVRWIHKMKNTRDFIREANNNIAEVARILTDIFGWVVEAKQLRKAMSRS